MILAAVKTLDEILDFASYLLAEPARRAHGQEIRVLSTKVVADMVEPIEPLPQMASIMRKLGTLIN